MSFKVFIGYRYLLLITNFHLIFKNDSTNLCFAYLSIFDFFLQNRNFFIGIVNFIEKFMIWCLKIFEDSFHQTAPNSAKNTSYC